MTLDEAILILPGWQWLLLIAFLCYTLGHAGGQFLIRKRVANKLRQIGYSPRTIKEIIQ